MIEIDASFGEGGGQILRSALTLSGGTHVPWSPCYHYLECQWLPYLAQAGYGMDCSLERAGFYQRGGGVLHVNIARSGPFSALRITERGRLLRIRGLSGVGRLDLSIAERQRRRALESLRPLDLPMDIDLAELPAASPGTFILLQAEFERGHCCAFALGAPRKPAETVADEAVDELRTDITSGGAIDDWLADQLLLPLSFVPEQSELSICRISRHLITNAELLSYCLPISVQIDGEAGQPGIMRLHGVAAPTCASNPQAWAKDGGA
ncbi:MAG: RNA 3'-terminal phosphate cyclase [Thiobacillaceae bacterium]